MLKFKKPIVAQDLVSATVENVWFDRQPMALFHPDEGKRDAKGQKFSAPPKEVTLRVGVVEISVTGEDGARYPDPQVLWTLHFYDDPGTYDKPGKGNGAGGMCGALVPNSSPRGYADLLVVASDVSKTGLDEMEAAYRTGKTDVEGRLAVEKWLQKSGRIPG